jgi:hypothetical protein
VRQSLRHTYATLLLEAGPPITPMRALAVKFPAVSEIDAHTSIVAAEAGPRQVLGPRRRPPLSSC